MNLQYRIDLLIELGQYILSNPPDWQEAKQRAETANSWFTPAFIGEAANQIAHTYLNPDRLREWIAGYPQLSDQTTSKTVGIIMAGNIPLVGFHDWLSVFISGHQALVKPAARDQELLKQLLQKIQEWDPAAGARTALAERLNGCDAYIATGSTNSSRYFDYYFSKYPHIIRRNRTSVALLTGEESAAELESLANDVHLYFGLGCRNVTKIWVPEGYDFIPLLAAFRKYSHLSDHHKYRNNYDYNLAILLLNKKYYMTNGSILLVEDPSVFSPISQLNYEYYTDKNSLLATLAGHPDIQAVVGRGFIPFGEGQCPSLSQYADGVDSLDFLSKL